MLGWSQSTPECPVDAQTRAWIDDRWKWLADQFGPERVRSARVILPTPEFFPDPYAQTAEDARLLLDRVCGYIGINPQTVDLSVYHWGALTQGTAGLYQEQDGKFHISVEHSNLQDPLALVATLSHELAHVHLLGHRRISQDVADHEPLTDLLTVFLGLGVLTANAVIREKHLREGHFSSWSMSRRGYLSMPMYGYALALFARDRGEGQPSWRNQLRPDVCLAFSRASSFLAEELQSGSISRASAASRSNESSREADDPETDENTPEPDEEEAETADGPPEPVSLSVEELTERYARGERDFCNVELPGLPLRGANLSGSNLTGADLSGADLTDAILTETDLHDAALQGIVLRGAVLRSANLSGADLSGADLSGADLGGADIRDADFTGASVQGAIFVGTLRNRGTDFADVDLTDVECDADLNKEQERLTARHVTRWVALALAAYASLAIGEMLGSHLGTTLETVTGADGLRGPCAVVGSCVLPLVVVWALVRSKRATEK